MAIQTEKRVHRNSLTIGKVARAAGVHVETVRYYERRGLIKQPSAQNGAFRNYPPGTVGRIRAIKRAQALGFSLEEIKGMLILDSEQNGRLEEAIKTIDQRLEEVEQSIKMLLLMKQSLRSFTSSASSELAITGRGGTLLDCLKGDNQLSVYVENLIP